MGQRYCLQLLMGSCWQGLWQASRKRAQPGARVEGSQGCRSADTLLHDLDCRRRRSWQLGSDRVGSPLPPCLRWRLLGLRCSKPCHRTGDLADLLGQVQGTVLRGRSPLVLEQPPEAQRGRRAFAWKAARVWMARRLRHWTRRQDGASESCTRRSPSPGCCTTRLSCHLGGSCPSRSASARWAPIPSLARPCSSARRSSQRARPR